MKRYLSAMQNDFTDWQPLEDAAELLLQGKDVDDHALIPAFRPLINMMRLILDLTDRSAWDWASPEVQGVFQEVAEGRVYRLFADVIVDMVTSVMKTVRIGTLVELGAGAGNVTSRLCDAMVQHNLSGTSLVISDRVPTVVKTGINLRKSYPSLDIREHLWDLRQEAPAELREGLSPPVLVFERFCLPYAGYAAIDMIAPLADMLIIVDDLSLTGQKASFDIIYEKIGTQFLVFDDVRARLEKHFSLVHTCDSETVEAVNSPVTSFTLALS